MPMRNNRPFDPLSSEVTIVLGGRPSQRHTLIGNCGKVGVSGLLHFDAHTDLLQERLGIQYCFATWAYHANELLRRDGRLVQVGIRASGRSQSHWESSLEGQAILGTRR